MNETPESYSHEDTQSSSRDDDLIRPFTGRAPEGEQVSGANGEDDYEVAPTALVRPYYLTGGRTRTHRPVAIEALVTLSELGQRLLPTLRLERLAIANACLRPTSVAEIAARTSLHLGVVRVLMADMAAEELVTTSDAPVGVADDIDLITRLIHGVRAL